MAMPFLDRPDCRLYYEVHGAGPAIVFAHGLGGNHLSWWQQIAHFRDRYTCVTFAHRGFYPSTAPPAGPRPQAFADDLAALIDHLGLTSVRLVAQSMGGWTCLEYVLRHPDRVRALVMAATAGTLDSAELERILREHAAARPEADLFGRGIHPAAGERMAREQPALHVLYQGVNALAVGLNKESLRVELRAMRTARPEAVAALSMPVLCITGEEDIVIPPAAVALLADVIPGARLVRVPQAGHSVYWERAETFNHLVDAFFLEWSRNAAGTFPKR